MKIWRINIQTKQHALEDVPEAWEHLGGRGLLAKILLDEVIPTCEPLDPNNKLVFAPGLLVGHRLSSLDRISIGGKSPLTGGIKEANAGGRTGFHLTQLGIKALIIEGKPEEDDLKTILEILKPALNRLNKVNNEKLDKDYLEDISDIKRSLYVQTLLRLEERVSSTKWTFSMKNIIQLLSSIFIALIPLILSFLLK